jgi:hypothetical protein
MSAMEHIGCWLTYGHKIVSMVLIALAVVAGDLLTIN